LYRHGSGDFLWFGGFVFDEFEFLLKSLKLLLFCWCFRASLFHVLDGLLHFFDCFRFLDPLIASRDAGRLVLGDFLLSLLTTKVLHRI
jgi:hypothetical protein